MRLPALLRPLATRTPQQNANWRSLAAGKIAPGAIYRSCSPIRNDSAAAAAACTLMEETGIRSVLNLSDSPAALQASEAKADARIAPYLRLCNEGRVLPLHLGIDPHPQENARALAHGLLWLASQPKPALIHCRLGLDRTGAVCILLEMLARCDYADIERDYQASYFNLFGLPPENGQGYPLCNLRFKELVDFLLTFVRESRNCENGSSTATDAERARSGIPGIDHKHPDSETLYLAARAYLAFGGLDEEQIDSIERMLRNEHIASEEAPR